MVLDTDLDKLTDRLVELNIKFNTDEAPVIYSERFDDNIYIVIKDKKIILNIIYDHNNVWNEFNIPILNIEDEYYDKDMIKKVIDVEIKKLPPSQIEPDDSFCQF